MRNILLVALTVSFISAPTGFTNAQDDRLVVKKDPSDASRILCDVNFATFAVPKGWLPNKSDKNTYAILSRSNESYPNVSQMISIDIGKPAVPTAKAMADAFARKWQGQVEDTALSIDGEQAYRVTIPSDKKTLRPIDCVVAMKGERVFLLIGGAKEDGILRAALDELVASWKWKN